MLEKIRQPFKRVIEPLARLIVRIGVSANAVTVIGTILTVLMALITGITGQLFWGAVGMTVLVLCDALDGSVAALAGGGTRFGAFLDSTLDRIADWAMLVSILIFFMWHTPVLSVWSQIGVWATVCALATSFLTPYARARAESINIEVKNGIATRADRILIILFSLAIVGLGAPVLILSCAMILLTILGIITVYQRIRKVYMLTLEDSRAR